MKTTAPIGYEMPQLAQVAIPTKYCLYARKSTESEAYELELRWDCAIQHLPEVCTWSYRKDKD